MTTTDSTKSRPIRKRVWVQNVAVNAEMLRCRLAVVEGRRGDDPEVKAVAASVRELLARAEDAAYRENPVPTRWANWWRGTLIEAAYQYLHAAEAQLCGIYDEPDLDAEVPEVLARIEAGLSRDDPRRAAALRLVEETLTTDQKRALLRKATEESYAASDSAHSRLRSFRNVLLIVTGLIAGFVGLFLIVLLGNPDWVPFCFPQERGPAACPTGTGRPGGFDGVVVALLGLTGGAVAAALAVRNLRGTSTPYDVPVVLAALKVPFGALTALAGLVAIRGDFVPGLSALDTQEQILAYALVLGYAQQAFTTLVDRQAQDLLNHVPSKASEVPRPVTRPVPLPRASSERGSVRDTGTATGPESGGTVAPVPVGSQVDQT